MKRLILGLAVCCGIWGMTFSDVVGMDKTVNRRIEKSVSFESLVKPTENIANKKKRSLSLPVTKKEKQECLALIPKLADKHNLDHIVDLLCSDKLTRNDAWDIYIKAYEIFSSPDVNTLRNLKMLEAIAVHRGLVPFGVIDSSIFWNMYHTGCMDCDITSAPIVDYSY